MPPGWAVDAAGAVRGRAAPDALVRAGAVAMLPRRAMDAARTVGRRTAPLAVLLVVTMFVLLRRAVDTTRTITRRTTMSAFCTHCFLLCNNCVKSRTYAQAFSRSFPFELQPRLIPRIQFPLDAPGGLR